MTNTFEKLEKQAEAQKDVPNETLSNDLDQFSDTAVGDKVKYVRESLAGQTVEVKSLEWKPADASQEPQSSMNGNAKYHKCDLIITYDVKNKDDINHREYLSGCIQFVQTDGTLSAPSFWYKGAENQVAKLWEAVAKAKNIEPEKLSPRQFMGFVNSGVKAKIYLETGKYLGKNWEKNLVEEFVA